MNNNKISNELVILFLITIFVYFFFVLTTVASGKIVAVDEDLSYVINHNTGEKFSYKDFRGKEVVEGHELEFVIIFKLLEETPDNSLLNARTTLINSKWEFGGKIFQVAEVSLDISKRPAGSMLKLGLFSLTPKGEFDVEEPIFRYLHKGVGKKEIFIDTDLYKYQDKELSLIEPIDKLLFFAVHPDFNKTLRQIEGDLNRSSVKYENPEYLKVLLDLAKKGHPGWAKEISKDFQMLEPKTSPPPSPPSDSRDWTIFVLLILLLVGIPSAIIGGVKIIKRHYRMLPRKLEEASKKLDDCDARLEYMRNKLILINAPEDIRNDVNNQKDRIRGAKEDVDYVKRELERI